MVMQAIRIDTYGGPEVMKLEELPLPVPGPGQALVRVTAASVNFLDVQRRRGELVGQAFYERAGLTDLPATMGTQGVGVVEALGPGVSNVHLGDRVGIIGDTYATHVLRPAEWLSPIPDGVSFEQAAAGLGSGFLAYAFTHGVYPVKPGDWCIVQAAAGGMGLLIVQMAKLRGGRVIGVTSSAAKAQAVREAGADEVIISTYADIAKEARRLTREQGVQVVYDGVGQATFEANLDSLAPGGYLVIYGQSSGYVPPFDIMRLQEKGSLFLTRTNGLYLAEKLLPQFRQDFVSWVQQGTLSIRYSTYPLAEAARAHTAFEARELVGRALLLP